SDALQRGTKDSLSRHPPGRSTHCAVRPCDLEADSVFRTCRVVLRFPDGAARALSLHDGVRAVSVRARCVCLDRATLIARNADRWAEIKKCRHVGRSRPSQSKSDAKGNSMPTRPPTPSLSRPKQGVDKSVLKKNRARVEEINRRNVLRGTLSLGALTML